MPLFARYDVPLMPPLCCYAAMMPRCRFDMPAIDAAMMLASCFFADDFRDELRRCRFIFADAAPPPDTPMIR